MIKEIINFTNNLSDNIKNESYKPSSGLHILVKILNNSCVIDNYQYYNGTSDLDNTLKTILNYELNSSYITMNQQQKFDNKQKIHSASPFSLAFNFSLGSDKSKIADIHKEIKSKMEDENDKDEFDLKVKNYKINLVKGSIKNYFSNAQRLCLDEISEELIFQLKTFENFCLVDFWHFLPNLKMQNNVSKKKDIETWEEVSILKELKEKEYVRIYLTDISHDGWAKAYTKYYEGEYPPNEMKDNDFISTFPDKKPFMTHQTASFDTVKISGKDAKILKQFKEILSIKPKVIPNPLPIFIYQDELQEKVITFFNDKEKSLGYVEIIDTFWKDYSNDFSNYYLIDWYVGKDIVFRDFDFVSKFEYEFKVQIENLFEIKDKGGKSLKYYPKISNIFQLEQAVFKPLIQSKYLKVDYLGDLDIDAYQGLSNTFLAYTKYRKAIYDYVYKSKRQCIDARIFSDMVFSHIKDDIKNDNGYGVKDKLNIWYSLYEKFDNNNKNNTITMASKLKNYQEFVAKLAVDQADLDKADDTHFAFAAGQVIEYVIQKSKSENRSYQLLEPYLQQSKCTEFKKALANDIARYKHSINDNEWRFKNVCAFVQTYDTDRNLKELLPEILAGVFAKNEFWSSKLESSK